MALSRYVVIDDRSWLVALWYPVPKRMFGTSLRSGLSMAAWSDSALGATKIDFVTFRSQLESPRATGSSVGGHWHDEFMSAWVWFAGAILLSIAEVLGAEFVLLMLGGGALVTAGAALLFPELLWLQLIVFALSSVALVLGLRPMLLRKYYQPAKIRSGIEAVIGSKATVVSTVDADGGQVKIGGEVWSAVSLEGHRALPPGTSVTVVEVRGATAVVIWGP